MISTRIKGLALHPLHDDDRLPVHHPPAIELREPLEPDEPALALVFLVEGAADDLRPTRRVARTVVGQDEGLHGEGLPRRVDGAGHAPQAAAPRAGVVQKQRGETAQAGITTSRVQGMGQLKVGHVREAPRSAAGHGCRRVADEPLLRGAAAIGAGALPLPLQHLDIIILIFKYQQIVVSNN